jgi:glycogen operon protein
MTDDDWNTTFSKTIAVYLNGAAIPSPDPRGQRIVDDSFLLLFNAHHEAIDWTIPKRVRERFSRRIDTWAGGFVDDERVLSPGERLSVGARSVVVLGTTSRPTRGA